MVSTETPHVNLPFFNPEACVTDIPEVEYKLALDCLKSRDTGHAIFHLGLALAADPCNEEYLKTAETIALVPNVFEYSQLHVDYYGIHYIRAVCLASRGAFKEAITATAAIAWSAGDHRFLNLGLFCLGHTTEIVIKTITDMCGSLLAKAHNSSSEDLPRLADWFPFLDAVFQRVGFTDEQFAFRYIALKRLSGAFEEALKLATSFVEKTPGFWSYQSLGSAHFAIERDSKTGMDYYERAAAADPQNEAAYKDIGDKHLSALRLEEAKRAYARALSIAPKDDWTIASLTYVHLLTSGSSVELEKLRKLAEDNRRARALMNDAWAYWNYVPTPPDLCTSIIEAWSPDLRRSASTIQITAGVPPCPSALLSISRHLQQLSPKAVSTYVPSQEIVRLMKDVGISFADYQTSVRAVRYSLWHFENGVAYPRYVDGDDAVHSIVREVADGPFNLPRWWYHAREKAQQLKSSAVIRTQLLSSMCSPGPTPSEIPVGQWIYRWQIACALILANLESNWEGSYRKEILQDLCAGAPDWSCVAAAVALVAIFHLEDSPESKEILADIEHLFVTCAGHKTMILSTAEYGLACCHLTLPQTCKELETSLCESKYQFEVNPWR